MLEGSGIDSLLRGACQLSFVFAHQFGWDRECVFGRDVFCGKGLDNSWGGDPEAICCAWLLRGCESIQFFVLVGAHRERRRPLEGAALTAARTANKVRSGIPTTAGKLRAECGI
jgi:hypothetical protein